MTSTVLMKGEDFLDIDTALPPASLCPGKAFDFSISRYLCSASCCVRFGGSGGSFAGSNTGALILPFSPLIDGVLEWVFTVVPLERADMDEMVEIAEEIDSSEAFLLS